MLWAMPTRRDVTRCSSMGSRFAIGVPKARAHVAADSPPVARRCRTSLGFSARWGDGSSGNASGDSRLARGGRVRSLDRQARAAPNEAQGRSWRDPALRIDDLADKADLADLASRVFGPIMRDVTSCPTWQLVGGSPPLTGITPAPPGSSMATAVTCGGVLPALRDGATSGQIRKPQAAAEIAVSPGL